jgi:DNA-binding response OmpR family regulator
MAISKEDINRERLSGHDTEVLFIGMISLEDELIASYFRENNIRVRFIEDVNASDCEADHHPDIVILNLRELTVASKREVAAAEKYNAPLICTIPLEDSAKISLLAQLAINDFVVRPYHLEDLVCRAKLLLHQRRTVEGRVVIEKRRRARRQSDRPTRQPWQPTGMSSEISIDDFRKVVRLRGEVVELTPKEYDIFCLLASEKGRVFSSDEIIKRCWGSTQRAGPADVQQYVHLLRKKVEADPKVPKRIITVKGYGYKLEAQADQDQ